MLRTILTLAALTSIAPTVTVFFVAQALLLYVEALALGVALAGSLPSTVGTGRVRPGAVRHLVGFSSGVGGTMVLGYAVMSIDQVVLSAMLPLAQFGYYTVAAAMSVAKRPTRP